MLPSNPVSHSLGKVSFLGKEKLAQWDRSHNLIAISFQVKYLEVKCGWLSGEVGQAGAHGGGQGGGRQ